MQLQLKGQLFYLIVIRIIKSFYSQSNKHVFKTSHLISLQILMRSLKEAVILIALVINRWASSRHFIEMSERKFM
jgi:hypothetical protein